MDVTIAPSVEYNIIRFISGIKKKYPELLKYSNINTSTFFENLDIFLDDQLSTVQHSTLTQRLRYIRWYMCFIISTNVNIDLHVLDDLDNIIHEMQGVSTNRLVNNSLMDLMNPYELVKVSNDIVGMLCNRQ